MAQYLKNNTWYNKNHENGQSQSFEEHHRVKVWISYFMGVHYSVRRTHGKSLNRSDDAQLLWHLCEQLQVMLRSWWKGPKKVYSARMLKSREPYFLRPSCLSSKAAFRFHHASLGSKGGLAFCCIYVHQQRTANGGSLFPFQGISTTATYTKAHFVC